ncbi:hypothetical protein EG68_05187 [Paragonimus skrjabini miyazakii]|uniref:Uncharacterized protein n=1 Tax=Paragonimus skrjabini miyazakii TaxID=59628 RepID=A0A8S9Z730_9TREM|nr:hypothetical protein EG68_05187 [Paragonimus skrjabini miyazakii]
MFGLRKITLFYAVTLCVLGVFGTSPQNETNIGQEMQLEQPQASGVLSKLIEAATLITGVQGTAVGNAILGLMISITTLLSLLLIWLSCFFCCIVCYLSREHSHHDGDYHHKDRGLCQLWCEICCCCCPCFWSNRHDDIHGSASMHQP